MDGIPLDGAALLKSAKQKSLKSKGDRSDDSDLDGAPLNTSKSYRNGSNTMSTTKSATSQRNLPAGFVPSKWETIDQKTVESQAVTSKWDIFLTYGSMNIISAVNKIFSVDFLFRICNICVNIT